MTFSQAWSLAFPQSILVVFIVTAVLSAVGFYKFVYFLSIGYGFAIAGAGIAMIAMFGLDMGLALLLLCLLFIVYGVRLSGFLLVREIKNASYRKTLKEATGDEKAMPIFVKTAIWILCSLMYTAQVSPVLYRLETGLTSNLMPIIGVVIMAAGIIIESVADMQKSAAKKINPNRICDTGLYKIVRCPNYFGELLFWTGVILSGFGALQGIVQWIIAILGYILIVYVMFSGAKRLEGRQNNNYSKDPEYRAYAKNTPIILPFIPLYSLLKYDWIK